MFIIWITILYMCICSGHLNQMSRIDRMQHCRLRVSQLSHLVALRLWIQTQFKWNSLALRERERQRDVIIAYSDYLELNSEIMLNIHYSSCWMQALRSSVQVVAQIMHIRTKCSFWWVCRAGRERGRGRDSIQFRCQFNDCTGWIIKIESCTSLLRRPNTQSWSKLDSPGTTIQKNKTNQHSPRFANTGVRWHGCASQ